MAGPKVSTSMKPYFTFILSLLRSWIELGRCERPNQIEVFNPLMELNQIAEPNQVMEPNQVIQQNAPSINFMDMMLFYADDGEINDILNDMNSYEKGIVKRYVTEEKVEGVDNWRSFVENVIGSPIGPLSTTVHANTISDHILGECCKHPIFKSRKVEYIINRMQRYWELKKNRE